MKIIRNFFIPTGQISNAFLTYPKAQVTSSKALVAQQHETQTCRNTSLPEATTKFAWELFKNIEAYNKDKNIIINPTSVQYLLRQYTLELKVFFNLKVNIIYFSILSVTAGGVTQRELCEVAMSNDPQEFENIIINPAARHAGQNRNEYVTANGIFIDQKVGIHDNFKNLIRDTAPLLVNSVDFAGDKKQKTIDYINAWASDSTRGTINQILNPSSDYSFTKILLASAVFFKGTWRTAFKISSYQDGFKVTEKQRIQVPFMYQQRNFYSGPVQDRYTNQDIGYFVELPYENNQFAMFIILPNENQSLENLIKKLNLQLLMSGTSPRSGSHDVNVTLPKFEIKFSQSLVQPLSALGLRTTFSPQASLPYLLKGESAAVADIVQDAFINVDETGTRAGKI